MLWASFWCIWFRFAWLYSMCICLNQPPICASIHSHVDRSANIWHWELIYSSKPDKILNCNTGLASLILIWTIAVVAPELIKGAPRIAYSFILCNSFAQFARYFVALNVIFTAYTLSATFHNFLSVFQQVQPMSSKVRNYYSQKNQ